MHKLQAVQLAVKFDILVEPGGDTGEVFCSFTVEAFFGTGVVLFWPDDLRFNPKRKNNAPRTTFLLLISTSSLLLSVLKAVFFSVSANRRPGLYHDNSLSS